MLLGYEPVVRGVELRHLRYFVAVADALNFSRAAALLRVTQPALSRQVRDLEGEVGCALLRRGANTRTELTVQGRAFLVRARELLTEADRLVRETRMEGARVRVGHYGALWVDYFSPVLRRFAHRHPYVRLEPIELSPRELPGALRRGEADVALVGLVNPEQAREFRTRRVAVYSICAVLAADHELAKRRRLPLVALRAAEWITWSAEEFPGRKDGLIAACRRAGFRPRIAGETDSMASMFVQVATSRLVGHAGPMARRLPHEGVVFVPIDPPESFQSEMHVAWRRGDPREELLEQFANALAAFGGGV